VTDSANLDLVRSLYAAWERGDFTSADWAHPEIEFARADGPDPGVWRGVAGMAGAWRDRAGSFEGFRPEVEEYRELDGERVLVLFRVTGRGKASGLDLGQLRAKGANLVHVRDGKVTRLVTYIDRERAFADLGLVPEVRSDDAQRPG
jgi:ketosteroid isomerase-like protein